MKEGENSFVSFAKLIENDSKKDDVTCVGTLYMNDVVNAKQHSRYLILSAISLYSLYSSYSSQLIISFGDLVRISVSLDSV